MLSSVTSYFKKIATPRSFILAFVMFSLILPFQNCSPTALKTSIGRSVATATSSQTQSSTGINTPPRVIVPIPPATVPNNPTIPVVAPPVTPTVPPTTPTTPPVIPTTPTNPGGPITLIENSNSQTLSASSVVGIQPNQIFQRKDSNLQATIGIKVNSATVFRPDLPFYSIYLLTTDNRTEKILASGQRLTLPMFYFELATGMTARRVKFSLHDAKGIEQMKWISPLFSVGELFLVSGQSNSTTHGEAATSSANSLNRAIDPTNRSWVPLNDPMPYASNWTNSPWNKTYTGGSPWPSFADELSRTLQVPVGVVSVGWGGSAVAWWKPNDDHQFFARLVLGAQAFPSCGFRAVLWHQGESDSVGKTSATDYQASLQTVVSSFRSSTGCQQNWIIARATYNYPEAWSEVWGPTNTEDVAIAAQTEIRKAQNNFAHQPTFKPGPDTDMLIGPTYRWDKTHLTVAGLKLHGTLWARYLTDEQSAKTDLLLEKNLIPEVQTIWNLYQSILNRTPEEIASDTEGVRYWLKRLSFNLMTEAQLADAFRASDEAFVRLTYTQIFGRQPTWDEMNSWLRKLITGEIASRDDLRVAIQNSK